MIDKDTLHRGAKIFLDSGRAETPAEAMAILAGFRLVCLVGPEIGYCPTLQTALLTAVNLAKRSFLGGVTIHGVGDELPLLTSLPSGGGHTLKEALVYWGGYVMDGEPASAPTVVFGTPSSQSRYPQTLCISCAGWRAAVAPLRDGFGLVECNALPVTGITAASLAVSEAFQHLCGVAEAMRRRLAVSLWQPASAITAVGSTLAGPPEPQIADIWLPQQAWILGLGHLGQAYLWTLLSLPYAAPEKVTLVLHDFDLATEANISTSMLTVGSDIGSRKTRYLAAIAESRGYQAVLQERPFNEHLRVGPDDPGLLLCGVDSARVRCQLEGAGFREIIEAGIGHAEDYLDFQLHSFPAIRAAEETWRDMVRESRSDRILSIPAYKRMHQDGMDQCGLLQIAEVAVGVPFVGAYVASLVVAEAIRAAMMGPRTEILSGSLGTPDYCSVLPRRAAIQGQGIGFLPIARTRPPDRTLLTNR